MSKTLFALILASSSVAAAEPRVAVLEDSPAPEMPTPAQAAASAPQAYVALGAATGADTSADWVYGSTSVEGGYRLNDTWWLHGRLDRGARIGYGAINQGVTLIGPEHPRTDALAGVEWRKCGSEAACFVAGSDIGYRFSNDEYRGGVELAPHVGLDIGNRHLRFRPGIEASMAFVHGRDSYGGEPALQDIYLPSLGIGATAAIAYQF